MSNNIRGEDVMYAILSDKDAKYILEINEQLSVHLTPTECVDLIEQAIDQFSILCDNVQQAFIDFTQHETCFTMVFTANNARLTLRGRKEWLTMTLEEFEQAFEIGLRLNLKVMAEWHIFITMMNSYINSKHKYTNS